MAPGPDQKLNGHEFAVPKNCVQETMLCFAVQGANYGVQLRLLESMDEMARFIMPVPIPL